MTRVAIAIEEAQDDYGITFVGVNTLADACEFFVCSGTPIVHEDDEDRLLLALRHILDAPAELRTAAGAHRGRTFTAVIGHPARRAYSVNGDGTNLAARVAAHAGPGQLLATTAILDRTRRSFSTLPVVPFPAKGKRALVEAREVGVATDAACVVPDSQYGFVGRDDELEFLVEALADVERGNGQVLEIVAEPGMGKSRLITELRSVAATRALVANVEPYASSHVVSRVAESASRAWRDSRSTRRRSRPAGASRSG